MNTPAQALETTVGALTAAAGMNESNNAYEFTNSATQALAYLGALALSPQTAGAAIATNAAAAATTIGKMHENIGVRKHENIRKQKTSENIGVRSCLLPQTR